MSYYESDLDLLAEVRKYGKFDVTGCFNCGSCTLSCELANDQASFPRKSVRHVVMGLKGLLHESLEPWVCHDCGDCSVACPRQTKPQESMMTLRRYLASVYDWTGIASLINRSKGWHMATLSFAAAVVLLLILLYHLSVVKMTFSDLTSTSNGLKHMFPIMTYFTLAVILIPLFILVSNAFRMYGFTASGSQNGRTSASPNLSQVKTFLLHFFTYKKMAECPTGKSRWLEHLFIGIGCLIMLAVKVFGLSWFQTDQIHPLFHPQRWLGYLATALILYGTGSILLGRITKEKEVYKSSEFADWIFLALLFATALSGIILHTLRLLGFEVGTCYTYAIHVMIATPMLVIEMPFGKWTHMIYRPLAVSLRSLSLKERTLEQQWSPKEVPEHATT
ncbi:MAG TPA: 4Fe-4S dicluster domain-containing protein [Thermodesulfobacteriota bacterium]|nr:4Fe-4S dicluster domain-containing protein [Thermodesulfobacteriota bacterium]